MAKLYTISGVDGEGDRQTVETASKERADDYFRQFSEDLCKVVMAEVEVVATADCEGEQGA